MIRDLVLASVVHSTLEYAGIGLGAWLFRRKRRQMGLASALAPGTYAVLVGLLAGAAIGNKLVFFIERPDIWMQMWSGSAMMLPGQSMVGGLIGGLVGVELAKWFTGQSQSTGDALISPIVAGLVVGRVGCFLAGLHDDTYGVETQLWWGVDLGDGIVRHPTALYEVAFLLVLHPTLHHFRPILQGVPGLAFKCFLSSYLVWRLLIDSLKPVRIPYALDLSGIQWVCLVSLLIYLPLTLRSAHQATLSTTRSIQ
jgi:phosphatidylglycerol---prolipoprotein diacylglyceryl transferase